MAEHWVTVVEECITLLKEDKVKPAIALLEALLPKTKAKRKKVRRAKDLTSSNTPAEEKKEKEVKSEAPKPIPPKEEKEKTTYQSQRKLSKSKVQSLQDFVTDESRKGIARTEKQEKIWGHIVNELYSTERDYIRDLHILIEIFRDPMLEQKLINKEESSKLFSNIDLILTVNEELLKQLESINSTQTDFLRKSATIPDTVTKDDLKNVTGFMTVVIRGEHGDVKKTLKIDGLTTLGDAIFMIKKKLPKETADSYDLYHDNSKFSFWIMYTLFTVFLF